MNDVPHFQALIGIGSSVGDRAANIERALSAIDARIGKITSTSRAYETPPFGGVAKNLFLNAAVIVDFHGTSQSLLEALQTIEVDLGRIRKVRWQDRPIDLDILMVCGPGGAQIDVQNDQMKIPHPLLLERDFALVPAAEIAGNWVHPHSTLTLAEELQNRGFTLNGATLTLSPTNLSKK